MNSLYHTDIHQYLIMYYIIIYLFLNGQKEQYSQTALSPFSPSPKIALKDTFMKKGMLAEHARQLLQK